MITAPKTAAATDLPSLGSSDEPITVWLPAANMAPRVLRIMMAKMEMTTLCGCSVSLWFWLPLLLYIFQVFSLSFFQGLRRTMSMR